MLERAWLLLHLLKLVNATEDAELGRASAASLVTTLGVGALSSEAVVKLSVEAPHDLIGGRRIWRSQFIREGIESKIIPKHFQPDCVVVATSQTICPINNLLDRSVVQCFSKVVPFRCQRNLVLILFLALPIEKCSVSVERPFSVGGQIEALLWKSATLGVVKYLAECHGVNEQNTEKPNRSVIPQ
jgi:hypothetical protein